jgi:hypothetical protein
MRTAVAAMPTKKRGLAWMGRAERCPNQHRRGERKDEKANRESCDQAEAHQEARHTPGQKPIPASAARLATPTPPQNAGDQHEKRPRQDQRGTGCYFHTGEGNACWRAAAG